MQRRFPNDERFHKGIISTFLESLVSISTREQFAFSGLSSEKDYQDTAEFFKVTLTETYSACCRGSRIYCTKDKDVSKFNKALSQTLDTIRSNATWIDVRGIRKCVRSALNLAFVAFYTRFIGMAGEVAKRMTYICHVRRVSRRFLLLHCCPFVRLPSLRSQRYLFSLSALRLKRRWE
jgi:hypothetical protein